MSNFLKDFPEICITIICLIVLLILSVVFNLPIISPSGERAEFVGIHYIYPLIGVAALGIVTFFFGKRDIAIRFMIALPCYAIVLFAHFNIKLWAPHINSVNFDSYYWYTDEFFRILVDASINTGINVSRLISYDANFYMTSYILMFYVSFLYHAIRTPEMFGRLIVSVILLQALGTVAYLIAPALGPFIYETGINPIITGGQASMLEFYQTSVANGPGWLASHGSPNFTAGLAAMPSLHAASAFLFFLFAFHHGRPLLLPYSFILFYILIMAVASRWHYVIDLPVGMLLAWVSYRLAKRLDRKPGEWINRAEEGIAEPAVA